MIWLPTNDARWRNLRRICRDHMFSMHSLDSSQALRREKIRKMHDYVRKCCDNGRAVDIADVVFTTTLNLISTSLFSIDFADFQSDTSQELKEIIHNVFVTLGTPNLVDYFPVLKWLDPQGKRQKTEACIDKVFQIFDDIIEKRIKSGPPSDSNDLLASLLELNQRNELSRDDIVHLLFDLFVAGTDTTATTAEWTMAELIRNPREMGELRNEFDNIIGIERQVEESDISNLPYLQAVVKESFRLHPSGALIPPHKADADTEINGFVIPKNAQVLVNTYASGRDPNIWSDPDCFNPKRFIGSKIDVKGHNFELIPFGSGRRTCPGLPLANRMMHLMVASLIQGLDWKLEGGMKAEDLNMDDKYEFSLQRAVPLKAIPIKI